MIGEIAIIQEIKLQLLLQHPTHTLNNTTQLQDKHIQSTIQRTNKHIHMYTHTNTHTERYNTHKLKILTVRVKINTSRILWGPFIY